MNEGLTPANLINAYLQGYFPMADDQGVVRFYGADPRAIFELKEIKPSKRMRRILRAPQWKVTRNQAFDKVLENCAKREETWINAEICEAYLELHALYIAHSLEVWNGKELVGGLYGVAIGGAFFGESMFNTVDNAAKVAFHKLIEHLNYNGFELLDTQFTNDFTKRLGAVEIPLERYLERLSKAVVLECSF